MIKKNFGVIIALIMLLGILSPCAIAAKETDFQLTIDVNERYTDISETVEGEDLFGYRQKEAKEKETKRATYIAVLAVALVAAVIVLVVTLRRVPKEEDIRIGDGDNKKEDKKE